MGCALCKHGERGNACKILVVRPERKRVLGRLVRRLKGNTSNITLNLRETECVGMG
jgi:hypothetical protein